jgi:hypothetical protein
MRITGSDNLWKRLIPGCDQKSDMRFFRAR